MTSSKTASRRVRLRRPSRSEIAIYIVEARPHHSDGSLRRLTAKHVLTTALSRGDTLAASPIFVYVDEDGTAQASVNDTDVQRHAGRSASLGEDGLEDAFGGDALPELIAEILSGDSWLHAPVMLNVPAGEDDDNHRSVRAYAWRRESSGRWSPSLPESL